LRQFYSDPEGGSQGRAAFLTSIRGGEYSFLIKGGYDFELIGRRICAAQESEFFSIMSEGLYLLSFY
jgi:hypothetical protein